MDHYNVSPAVSLSDDDVRVHRVKPPQDSMFTSIYRSTSFADISRQTDEQELSIVLDGNDTLMKKLSPSISKKMIKV